MGVVNLARVDERLIHGQVMVTLSQKVALIPFSLSMKWWQRINLCVIYTKVQAVGRDKNHCHYAGKAKFYWDEYQFKEYNCILIAKTVSVIYDLVKHGVPMKELNIGGIAQKNPEKDLLVTKSVYLNKEDAEKLKELHEVYGVEDIYFQATPSAPKLV